MRARRDIKTNLFIRKFTVFLKEISNIPIEEREEFVNNFVSEEKRQEFGQTVMMLIDRAEDMKKSYLIAKVISAYLLGEIDEFRTMRLCYMINRCYTQYLNF